MDGMASRPVRALLTALGTAIGIAALVSTVGMSESAAAAIRSNFDALSATEVTVEVRESAVDSSVGGIDWGADRWISELDGVVQAGTQSDIVAMTGGSVRVSGPSSSTNSGIAVQATSPEYFEAIGARLEAGRFFDSGHSERSDRVAVIGRRVAERLAIGNLGMLPVVFIDDTPFAVIGIIDAAESMPSVLSSITLPEGTAQRIFDLANPTRIFAHVEPGWASSVGSRSALAVKPLAPESLVVRVPPEPSTTRIAVTSDSETMLTVVAIIALAIGALVIANVSLVSVMERRQEIGLRRALGSRRRHIATQFVAEATLSGVFGGLLGASLGIVVTVIAASGSGWTPVLPIYLPFVAPAVGAAVGLVAGLYPALRAASVDPVAALRGGGI